MISGDVVRLVTTGLHYRTSGDDADLLLYSDTQRELLNAINGGQREAEDVIDELVNLLTISFIRMAELRGLDPVVLWRTGIAKWALDGGGDTDG